MKKIKIGILGCGAVAYRWYLKGLAKDSEDFELYAVCDLDLEKAKQTAATFNVPHVADTKEKLVELGIDLVVILTRHADHPPLIKYFLNNNIHVYSEKPFAPNAVIGRKLVALAESKKMVFASAPQVMFSSRNQTVKKLIEEGAIGDVAYVRVSSSNLGPAGRADTDYNPVWFYNEGGSLSSLGIYGLSALLWIMGKPQRVSSFQGIAMPNREVLFGPFAGTEFKVTAPDSIVSLFAFPNDVFAVFDGSYVMTTPPRYEMEFHGTKGSLMVGGFGGPDSIHLYVPGKPYAQVGPDDDCHLTWNLSWGVEDAARAILEKRPPKASSTFALDVIGVMDAMALSTKTHKHISLKTVSPTS
jgi:predicted dehydrogenase